MPLSFGVTGLGKWCLFSARLVIDAVLSKKKISDKEKHQTLISMVRKCTNKRDRILLLNYCAHIRKEISNG